MTDTKQAYVAFADVKLEREFETLKEGKFQDKRLYQFIERAIKDMKNNPACGIKIPKRLWPKTYVEHYDINNLWKYDLPNGWRLLYTIKEDEVKILNVVLEWFDHKEYEKRFNY